MIDLLTQYLNFMAQGPQEFCIGCIVPGFFGMFAQKLPTNRNFEPKSTGIKAKAKGRKPKQKRTARKNRVVQKPKQTQESAKSWAKPPTYTASEIANIERMFRVGRGEVDDSRG